MKANNKDYILMRHASTYALGMEALRESYNNGECSLQPIYTKSDSSRIVRPLTFNENLQAKVEDYNTLNNADGSKRTKNERLRFFNKWPYSCTGIAYKAGTTKFKIVHQSLDLIEIPSGFKGGFLLVNYDSINGVELDSSKGKYDNLYLSQVKSHPAWLAAVEDDKALLSQYADIVFSLLNKNYMRIDGMGFGVMLNTETDELRALFVDDVGTGSNALGNCNLSSGGSFLRVVQSQNFSTENKGEKQ